MWIFLSYNFHVISKKVNGYCYPITSKQLQCLWGGVHTSQEGTAIETYGSPTLKPVLASASECLCCFLAQRSSQDCTSQHKIGHVHPQPPSLGVDTLNATRSQSYTLECNRWGCRPKKDKGAGFEPPEYSYPLKVSDSFLFIFFVLQRHLSSGNQTCDSRRNWTPFKYFISLDMKAL